MNKQIISLSNNAANRIKEIMSNAEKNSIGVRIGVKSGGCAGMSYVMEYAKKIDPSDELIEDKGVKVFIDPGAKLCIFLELKWIIKRNNSHRHLYLIIPMRQRDVDVENLLKFKNHVSI